MSNITKWEQIVSQSPELQKQVIKAQETIASELSSILELASKNGIDLSISDIVNPQSNNINLDDELAAAAGGVDPCGATAGASGIACGIGAIFSLGASAIASATIITGAGVASNTTKI